MSKEAENLDKETNKVLHISSVIPRLLLELKKEWEPKTKTKIGYGYHGSSKGDKIEYVVYFDDYKNNWTTKSIAFEGFVFKRISEFLNDV
jgi:hypothetical protein